MDMLVFMLDKHLQTKEKNENSICYLPIHTISANPYQPRREFKSEGLVLGVGAKLFQIAGPVLVYGISTSIKIGFIYYLFTI